jgi:hypothetical protein
VLEEVPRHLRAHQLEAALRVAERQPAQRSHEEVEDPPHVVAPKRRPNERAVERPGADGHVRARAQQLGQLAHLAQGRGEVDVREQHQLAAGLAHPARDRTTLAVVRRTDQHGAEQRIAGHPAAQDLVGVVRAAVVDHYRLEHPQPRGGEVALGAPGKRLEQLRQPAFFVERGRDD